MGELERIFDGFNGTGGFDSSSRALVASLLAALFLGQLVAWVYTRTHTGLSYSRTFTQSIVLLMMVSALVMYVIGDSMATAFGLIGALAIIRFRNVLKDTRDTMFVFFSLVLGMALGSQRFAVALVGGLMLLAVTAYLHFVGFGERNQLDGHLTLSIERDPSSDSGDKTGAILRAFCRQVRRITSHDEGGRIEYVHEIRLRDPRRGSELVDALRANPSVSDVVLSLRDPWSEL